jgi:hypothetical protein
MRTPRLVLWTLLIGLSLTLGFWLSWKGAVSWDQAFVLSQGHHLLGRYLGEHRPMLEPILAWYAPLWPLISELAAATLFAGLNDPHWVYTALNLALFPLSLFWVAHLLVKAGVSRQAALLGVMMLAAFPRLGGHAAINLKDFPAAMGYLISTLGLFNHMVGMQALTFKERLLFKNLARGAAWALLPYLLRFPLVFHLFAWSFTHVIWALKERVKPVELAGLFGRSLIAILALMYAVWPNLWTATPRQWIDAFRLFTQFGSRGSVRFFGADLPVTDLPFWYPLSWLPISLTPTALAILIWGATILIWQTYKRLRASGEPSFQVFGLRITVVGSLLLFSCVPLAAMIVRGSVIFDEERHLLFIYLPLILALALGLRALPSQTLLVLSLVTGLSGAHAYSRWGLHSYIYKSPLIGKRPSSDFMGDYWGACFAEMIRLVPKHQPEGGDLLITGAKDLAKIYAHRLQTARFSPVPLFPSYQFYSGDRPQIGGLLIANNRTYLNESVFERLRAGELELLERTVLPSGDDACVLVRRVR